MADSGHQPVEIRTIAPGRLVYDVRRYAELGSTNTVLRDLATGGAPEGTVVVADGQTAGRGRFQRSWNSPAGAGLYASILTRPRLRPTDAQVLTFVAAIAVAEALGRLGLDRVEIKWPNDVLARERKICGILTESSLLEGHVDWAVVGVGVNLLDVAVPDDLHAVATSLEGEGVRATSFEVLEPLLESFDRWYGSLVERGSEPVLRRWAELAPMASGRDVRVDDGREVFDGTTEGMTPRGVLLVRRADGTLVEVTAADVTLVRR